MALTGDSQGVQESFPTPTQGQSIPEYVVISGAGVTSATSSPTNVFKCNLSLHGQSSVQLALTGSPVDAFGNGCNGGTVNWVAYAATSTALSTNDPQGVVSAYPPGSTAPAGAGYGLPPQQFVGVVINQAGVVTAYTEGHYIISARVLPGAASGALDASTNTKSSYVYGSLHLKVVA
jgi:hypothetical protein